MHIQIVLFDGFDPLDVVAPYAVLYTGGTASGGAVTVELVSAEGPREVISGTRGLGLRAAGALDLERADMLLVPGASGRVGEPGEVPEEEVGAGEWKQDEFIPVLLGRTLTTELPALLKRAMDDPDVTVATVCGGSLVQPPLTPGRLAMATGIFNLLWATVTVVMIIRPGSTTGA
ncbi:hypothetical protein [Streptomyces flaveolus]|uniref:hypothetical protein n=1 Tax=Streptomyces flaveolus TaxID=67297 RepID=UPI00331EA291